MRVPIPNNKLVAFTLVGAVLTAVVAGALATPVGFASVQEETGTDASATQQLGDDAPEPNESFTPAVQTQPEYEEHEEYDEEGHEEREEYDEEGHEEREEYDEEE